MSDTECDLDELTAILEQDDDDDGDLKDENPTCESEVVHDPDKETTDKDELGKDSEFQSESDDECSLDELSAMLDQSDDEDDNTDKRGEGDVREEIIKRENEAKCAKTDSQNETTKHQTDHVEEEFDDFDDFDDSDMEEEMVKSLENQSELESKAQSSEAVNCSIKQKTSLECNNGMHSKTGQEETIEADSEAVQVQSEVDTDNLSEKEVENQSPKENGYPSESDIDSQSEAETGNQIEEETSSKSQGEEEMDVGNEEEEESADEADLSADDILAEMKRMSERMKQFEALLMKSESKKRSSSSNAAKEKTPNKASSCQKTKWQNSVRADTPNTSIKRDTTKSSIKSETPKPTINTEMTKVSVKTKVAKHSVITETTKCSVKSESPKPSIKSEAQQTVKSGRTEVTKHSVTTKTKYSTKSESPKPYIKTESQKTVKSGSPKMLEKSHHDLKRKSPSHKEATPKRDKHDIERKRSKSSTKTSKDEVNLFFEATQESDHTGQEVDPHSLFGDSDDSDWEGLDGEKKSNLSDEGQEMKKLLNKGPRQRVAHTPNYDPSILKKSPPTRWTDRSASPANRPIKTKPVMSKPELNPETGTVSGKYTLREEYKTKPVTPDVTEIDEKSITTDPYCGIKIINPRISMSEFKIKMSGRALIKVSHIHQKVGRGDLQKDNWVTIGVVVHKTEPRQSASGKSYCIWKLSDLLDCDKTVSFFLFGNVYKEHWKNHLGTVIGLLNPSMMDKAEKAQSELAFTINHPQQMLHLGVSKDLGKCKGTTKAGNPCSHFINKSQGEYCTYHVQAAYKKSSAKRTELQASTGITPKAFANKGKKGSGAECFFYGGQTFTTMKPQAKSTKDNVTLKKLQHAEANKGPIKVTTMSLHELEPDNKSLKKLEEKDAALLEKLMVPTAGSMNLVKHLVKKDKPKNTDDSKSNQHLIESVSAKDLLKQHQSNMKRRIEERKTLAATPTLGKGFSVGQEISLDVPVKKSKSTVSAQLAKSIAIAKLKEKGGVSKEDPNAVRKKLLSPEQKEKIRKRVAEDIEDDNKEDRESSEPPRKRSKFLGNVDLNDPDVQKLLKAKSKHKGALAEAEAEHEEKYFMGLEKKEKMEEKMDSIKEVQVKLFKCKQCQYTAFSLADRCKKEQHQYKVVSGMKRFFKCKQCKKRIESIEKYPTKPCKNCGNGSFERVSMLKERSGPKLESEELSLRGNEQKHLGSLNEKSYLNI